MVSLEEGRFSHDRTEYPLEGKHVGVACVKCHKKAGAYAGASTECVSCHKDEHRGRLDRDCGRCHSFAGWKDIGKFNHDTGSKYALTWKHAEVKCAKCHAEGRYKPLNFKRCDDCHKDVHKKQFQAKTCESCHDTKGWKKTQFDHNAPEYKGYKLDGRHVEVKCEKCHTNGKYRQVSTACLSCHEKDDVHKKELGEVCKKCHTTADWKKTTLDHNLETKFPLIGKHKDTSCVICHENKRYKTKAETCADCHKDEHKGQFKEGCDSCHTQSDWAPRSFDHRKKTGYELGGVHNDIVCASCHKKKGTYKDVAGTAASATRTGTASSSALPNARGATLRTPGT